MIKDKNMEELFKDAQNGNMEAREAIVKQYMGLVYSNAKKYALALLYFKPYSSHASLSELNISSVPALGFTTFVVCP